MHQCFF